MQSKTNLYQLNFSQLKTYLVIPIFIIGNILFPQLCHLIPYGGRVFLPIYFFTLVCAYKYGIKVGLVTAILSPLLNLVLFGMPPSNIIIPIIIKSVILAVIASLVAKRYNMVSLLSVLFIVVSYQIVGTIIEWGLTANFQIAVQDLYIGLPGLVVQILFGFLFIKYVNI